MRLLNFKHDCHLKPLLMVGFFILLLSTSSIISAKTSQPDPIGEKLCDIIGILSGKTTKAICLIAIIVLGITVFTGKVNWSTAMITVIAIIIITQAPKVYEFIAGKDSNGSTTQCQGSSK
ncbi:TrbC/VirB2 family protein [Orientia tsutsugamushi]|uniref:TrbC/VirB2 family protein n=1 Tax=Orientia tsutsugamushi TaxID=784 RepID=UPI00030C9914|nr:TrbC/VirB2 family protein [Orientia tsutsugamushi]